MVKSGKTGASGDQKTAADLRTERRAEALRANLRRRKEQARQRTDDGESFSSGTKKDKAH